MKNLILTKNKVVFYFLIVLALYLLTPQAFADKYYQIIQVDIDGQLRENGIMEVTESRTYRFVGSFSYAFRTLPTTGPVSFEDFRVSERGQFYRLSDSRAPGTYQIIPKPKEIEIRWYFRARGESRTFDFHYHVKNAVLRHDDVAVLYFQFISGDWDRWSKNVHLALKPPKSLLKTQINEWLHGPLWAESKIEEDGTITAWCERLPKYTYFEVRALYPPEVFPDAGRKGGRVRSQIMREEAAWAEAANRERERAIKTAEAKKKRQEYGKWIMIIFSLAGLLGWWGVFRKYGKRPELPSLPSVSSDVPWETSPALVGYLLGNQQISGGALVATLLDLARRGFIALREEEEEKKAFLAGIKKKTVYILDLKRGFWSKNPSKLEKYEDDLIRFIFNELADGQDSIDLKIIGKKKSKFMNFFRDWKKDVKELGKQQRWFDKMSNRGMLYSLGIAGTLFLLTIPSMFLFGSYAAIIGSASVVVFVLSLFIPHRTKEGEMKARQWKALRSYLQKYHYRTAERSTLLGHIDSYFVYGVVLGLSKKIFQELANFIPADEYGHYVPWYVCYGARTGGFTPEAFASAFSSMIATTTSAMSTASGAGGGASAGGGGGASSGGGGAG
ncbi:MAG: DUF2207 domain-containing protein [Candidatus Aminicenantes bacterium]|nr:MAG: DUF2207 domain-containing protein [Candidatus Aminicenantes bacterium]